MVGVCPNLRNCATESKVARQSGFEHGPAPASSQDHVAATKRQGVEPSPPRAAPVLETLGECRRATGENRATSRPGSTVARLVQAERARPALAPHARSLCHLDLRNNASANTGCD